MRSNLYKRYLLVGGSSFCIELAVLYVLKNVLKLSSEAAVTISFWTGFMVAFTLQKQITYQNKQKAPLMLARQLATYSALVAFNYLFTLLMVIIFKNNASVFIIRSIVVFFTTLWNYFAYKIIFAQGGQQT